MSDDLDRMESEAAVIDGQADAAINPATEADAAPVVDVPAEVAALLQAVAGLFTPLFPSLGTIYTPETCRRLGDAAAPVMDKYGLSVGGLFDRWGAEITLAATAFPVAMATWQGIKADTAARKTKPAERVEPVQAAHQQPDGVPAPALFIGSPG